MKTYLSLAAVAATMLCGTASAAIVTYTDTDLASGFSVTVDGLNLTTSTADGDLSTIGSGIYTGLYIGVNDANGKYDLTFGSAISSIEIEFDALSNTGGTPEETIFDFLADGSSVSIGYTNQDGTTFDGSTIASTANDGMGIITYSGTSFSTFSFSFNQNPGQNGFVIENIVVDTGMVASQVPLPASSLLLLGGLGMIAAKRRTR